MRVAAGRSAIAISRKFACSNCTAMAQTPCGFLDMLALDQTFFNEYQGLATWHDRARADANNPGVTEVRTHRVGRRQHLAPVEHWWSRFTSLLNTPIQGTCAEVTKLCLLDIGEKLTGRAQLVSCVHDEIIVECAEDDAEAVLAEVQTIMETRSAQVFNGQRFGVEAHVEDNWAGVKIPTRSTENGMALSARIELVSVTHRLPRKASRSLCGSVSWLI